MVIATRPADAYLFPRGSVCAGSTFAPVRAVRGIASRRYKTCTTVVVVWLWLNKMLFYVCSGMTSFLLICG